MRHKTQCNGTHVPDVCNHLPRACKALLGHLVNLARWYAVKNNYSKHTKQVTLFIPQWLMAHSVGRDPSRLRVWFKDPSTRYVARMVAFKQPGEFDKHINSCMAVSILLHPDGESRAKLDFQPNDYYRNWENERAQSRTHASYTSKDKGLSVLINWFTNVNVLSEKKLNPDDACVLENPVDNLFNALDTARQAPSTQTVHAAAHAITTYLRARSCFVKVWQAALKRLLKRSDSDWYNFTSLFYFYKPQTVLEEGIREPSAHFYTRLKQSGWIT